VLERPIEEHLVKRIKAKGGIAYKFTSPQRRSVPDRLVLHGTGGAGFALMRLLTHYGVPLSAMPGMLVLQAQADGLIAAAVQFVELKATGKKATILQEREHAFLRNLGFEVLVIDSKEEIDKRWPK
jgi:hypothetical protein